MKKYETLEIKIVGLNSDIVTSSIEPDNDTMSDDIVWFGF